MTSKRDFIAEIEELRERSGPSELDDGILKLLYLLDRLNRLREATEENNYFLIGATASIETYIRVEIRKLIDSGDRRFLQNIRIPDSMKITAEVLTAVHGKRASMGELIAHTVPLSSVESIHKSMSDILQTDFLKLIRATHEAAETRNKELNPGSEIRSFAAILADVSRTYKLRHIICHEARFHMPIEVRELKRMCSSCYDFLTTTNKAIAKYAYPNAPRSLQDATAAAVRAVEILEKDLRVTEKHLLKILHGEERRRFSSMQRTWRTYVERTAGFAASLEMNGNRGDLMFKRTVERLYRERLIELRAVTENGQRTMLLNLQTLL